MSLKCRVFVWGCHGNRLIFMAPSLSWQLTELMGHINIIKLIIYYQSDKTIISGRNVQNHETEMSHWWVHVNITITTISSVTWTDKDAYLFFMRSTTPKKIMTKSRMPAMTPAIFTVWSVCFSGSTASGLWVADPERHSLKHQNS